MRLSEYIKELQKALETTGDREGYKRRAMDDSEAITVPVDEDPVYGLIYVIDNKHSWGCEKESQRNQYMLD